MRRGDDIDQFVRDALIAGRSRGDIAAALGDAGWNERVVSRALAAYADTGFPVPVPRPRDYVTARDAFVYALTFMALAVAVINAVSGGFDLIEWALRPDGPRALRIEWELAALIVFVPLFVGLDRRARGDERRSPLRRIFAYAAAFISALVILFALVAVIALILGGGLVLEFALKALLVVALAAIVGLFYRRDLTETQKGEKT